MDYRQEPEQTYEMEQRTHPYPCERVIRLEAKLEAIEAWREEVTRRLDSLSGNLNEIFWLGITTLVSLVCGLLYIILNRIV